MRCPSATIFHEMYDIVFESTHTVTPDEFEAFVEERAPGDVMHYQLLNGRIVVTPPAGYPHGEVASRIQAVLAPIVWSRKRGKVFDSSQGFRLPSGDTVEPDLAFVSSERWAAGPPPVDGTFLRVVPDLVFEILSKSTAPYDRNEKKAIYEANGVREYWIVDTRAREVVHFALDAGRYGRERVHASSDRATSTILPELVFEVADILP